MNEIWKDIAGFDGAYQVSNLGRVKSLKRKTPRIMKPKVHQFGYLRVGLMVNGKKKYFRVARLVALAFIPNPENKPEVNHDNGIKTDNRVENLIWATGSENVRHALKTGLRIPPQGTDAARAKLTAEQVLYIRNNPDNLSIKQLAEMFNVGIATIANVQFGRRYKNVGGKIREPLDRRIPTEIREQIRNEYKPGVRGFGIKALAKKFGINPETVAKIVHEVRK